MSISDQQGVPIESSLFDNELNLDYLSINTLIHYNFPVKEKIKPFISLGPRVDFLLKKSAAYELVALNFNQIAKWPVSADNIGGKINDRTLALSVSLGYIL